LTKSGTQTSAPACSSHHHDPDSSSAPPAWDVFFGDHVGLHRFFAKQFSLAASRGGRAIQEVEYVDGIENPSESFPNIVRWLVVHGYTDGDIAAVIGGNVMRALAQVWTR
jgi:membrane dipeptidase